MKPSHTTNDLSFRAESAGAFSSQFTPANWPADATRNLLFTTRIRALQRQLLDAVILKTGEGRRASGSHRIHRRGFFRTALALSAFTSPLPAAAQAPQEVPVAQEPGHHKVFENSYVRVFRVTIPANQKSLLHRHDLDYAYVSLGPADVINAIVGKPEARVNLEDGHIGFAKGGFAHVATAVGMPFNNVTIELLKPQGEPHNLCDRVAPGPLGRCNQGQPNRVFSARPVFETDEVRVVSNSLAARAHLAGPGTEFGKLFIVGNDSELQITRPGEAPISLRSGETLWLDPGVSATVACPLEQGNSRYLVLFFKAAKPVKKPPQ